MLASPLLFAPIRKAKKTSHHRIFIGAAPSFVVLTSSSDPNNYPPDDGNTSAQSNDVKKQRSIARAGGRRQRTEKQKPNNQDATVFLPLLRQWALPLCLLAIVMRLLFSLFGGNNSSSNPNVVYYSRSVYQSTTYTGDGNIETKRKESFQSNIPRLVEQSKDYAQKQQNNGADFGGRSYLDLIDEDLEDLNEEIDSLMFEKW